MSSSTHTTFFNKTFSSLLEVGSKLFPEVIQILIVLRSARIKRGLLERKLLRESSLLLLAKESSIIGVRELVTVAPGTVIIAIDSTAGRCSSRGSIAVGSSVSGLLVR